MKRVKRRRKDILAEATESAGVVEEDRSWAFSSKAQIAMLIMSRAVCRSREQNNKGVVLQRESKSMDYNLHVSNPH